MADRLAFVVGHGRRREPGRATGTVLRALTVAGWVAAAGFTRFEVAVQVTGHRCTLW